jgi:hypothetical protein
MGSGSGQGTPISVPIIPSDVGGAGVFGEFISPPQTLLSLWRYAQVMGLDPMHFFGGFSALRAESHCNDIWAEFDWQDNDKVSRSQLTIQIADAERSMVDQLKFWPGPVWVADELMAYPHPRNSDMVGNGLGSDGKPKAVTLNYGYVISGGIRATEQFAPGVVTRLADVDADGDTWSEWAVFRITGVSSAATACEIKAFFKSYTDADAVNTRPDPNSIGADPRWEVRPIYVSLSGGVATVRIPRYMLFKPQKLASMSWEPVNADDGANYVDTLEFYREYNDPSHMVQFLWGEDACNNLAGVWQTQEGVMQVQDRRAGIVVPQPATYNDGEWNGAVWTTGREPDALRAWYRAGVTPAQASVCDPLDPWWAETIAVLATARLSRPLCGCGGVAERCAYWQQDLATTGSDGGFMTAPSDLNNPFGTRRGEAWAWKRIQRRTRGRAILI